MFGVSPSHTSSGMYAGRVRTGVGVVGVEDGKEGPAPAGTSESGRPLFMIWSVVGDWVMRSEVEGPELVVGVVVSAGAEVSGGESDCGLRCPIFLLVMVENKRDMT